MKLRAVLSLVLIALAMAVLSTFGRRLGASTGPVAPADQMAVAAEIEALVRRAHDPEAANAAERRLALYPDSGNVASAEGGRLLTARDSVAAAVRARWADAGRDRRNAQWVWDRLVVDVLAADAAVVTGSYRVPHLDAGGATAEAAGAWTAALVKREGRWMIVQEHHSEAPPASRDEPAAGIDTAQLRGRRY